MTLLESTRKLLDARLAAGIKPLEIVEAAGGKLKREWLYKFIAKDIENPGVTSVQTLHDCLQKIRPSN